MIFLLRLMAKAQPAVMMVCRMSVVVLVLLVIWLDPAFCAGQDLSVTLSVQDGQEGSGSITFTLTNTSQSQVRVLRWNTPLEGSIVGDIFAVTKDGRKIRYRGKQVKRAPAGAADYLTIQAGESVSAVTSLLTAYDISETGQYEVRYGAVVQYSLGDGSVKSPAVRERISSNILLLDITQLLQPAVTPLEGATYLSCSAAREAILESALNVAGKAVEESLAALQAVAAEDQTVAKRYTTWFGAYSAGRYTAIEANFSKLAAAFTEEEIELRCDCTEDWLAYVYVDDPYIIHLCSDYWVASPVGTDSQAGTLIHEMTHFSVVAATDDVVYGQDGAMELALTNPGQAINNADSHEYFAENVPFLPMAAVYTPMNNFGNAPTFASIPLYAMGNSSTANKEAGEPNHAGADGGHSVWVTWRSPINGQVRVSTLGSRFDTLLAVYTGNTVGALTLVAANDDADTTRQSKVSFMAAYGHTYHFAVDGYGSSDFGIAYLALTSDAGDIDLNGTLDLTDLLLSLQVLTGMQPERPVSLNGDVDGNGDIGIAEAVYILKSVAANPYN